MYSIIEVKGKQYVVSPGQEISVDALNADPDSNFEDYKVLLHKESDENVLIGTPHLENVKVEAKVVSDFRAKKVIAVRYKPKSGYITRRGHRQTYTKIKIENITVV